MPNNSSPAVLQDVVVEARTRPEIRKLCATFKKSPLRIIRNPGEIPALSVHVPDSWPYFKLVPWYDVHFDNKAHDRSLLEKHVDWFIKEPYCIGYLGGDIIENASKLSIGDGVYAQDKKPQGQVYTAVQKFAAAQHKLCFSIPGNHEARTEIMGISISEWIATLLDLEYSPDYMFVTFHWRGHQISLLAHHGAGGAATPGAQRMSLRKLTQVGRADLYIMGHLHCELVDKISIVDFDQSTGKPFEREALGVITPSYLRYFGTYAAAKILPITSRGLTVITVVEDQGEIRLDASVHAKQRRS